jgi:hypothetical protein
LSKISLAHTLPSFTETLAFAQLLAHVQGIRYATRTQTLEVHFAILPRRISAREVENEKRDLPAKW